MEPLYDGRAAAGKKGTAVPQRLRVGLPILVAADVALLVAAHVAVGATTNVGGTAPFGLLKPHVASSDNLFSAVGKLAGAKAWLLVIIVAIMSGFLPYVKLLATCLAVGLVDAGRISRDRAVFYLGILKVLGKYSFADVFLVCLNLVMFDIHTGLYKILGLFNLEIDLVMQLHFASLALLVAVTASAILTQWAAFELSSELPPTAEEEMPLHSSPPALCPPHVPAARESSAPLPSRRRTAVVLVALAAVLFTSVGAALPLVRVGRGGFFGKLSRPAEDRILHISVVSMGTAASGTGTSAAGAGGQGIREFFVVSVLVLALVVPLLELVCLIVSAATSEFNSAVSYWSRVCAGFLSSFDCLEVTLFVAVATLVDLGSVVGFNIGDECKPFVALMTNKPLLTLAGLGFASSTECFVLQSHIRSGFFVIALAVALRSIAWHLSRAPGGDEASAGKGAEA